MKLSEKIRQIRKKLGLSIRDVERILEERFSDPKEKLSYATLRRIEDGEQVKNSSILKLCTAYGISLADLYKDTDLEQTMVIRKDQRLGAYYFNEKVTGEIISSPNSKMFSMEVTFKPYSKTLMELDPIDKDIEKIVYLMMGTLTCFIGEEVIKLKPKDSITFKTSMPHHFENNTNKKCVCLITQTPKYY